MKKNFTKKFIYENSGCYDAEDIDKYWPKNKTKIHINDILNSEIPLKDKYWFICKKLATKKQNIMIAISVAEIVLHLFENRYPKDKRPRKAIEVAKKYLKYRSKNYAAADDAYADDAAAAAYIDAYAYAYAAYAAAAAAADAAYAAAAAAYAAAYAADDKSLNNILLKFLIDFCNK